MPAPSLTAMASCLLRDGFFLVEDFAVNTWADRRIAGPGCMCSAVWWLLVLGQCTCSHTPKCPAWQVFFRHHSNEFIQERQRLLNKKHRSPHPLVSEKRLPIISMIGMHTGQ